MLQEKSIYKRTKNVIMWGAKDVLRVQVIMIIIYFTFIQWPTPYSFSKNITVFDVITANTPIKAHSYSLQITACVFLST